ncbi:MAG TPA: sodium:calcium antiporter [Deltaproteobacteria bacterium]|nr:sodium:calcium antiporter [Deltaproteobacteria bacterium]
MLLWFEFAALSSVIVASGTMLSRYGDVIAEKSGLGRVWIGLILMAGVTSLPELITGVSSVAVVGAPDIAIGDVLGSCIFNLGILALMDIWDRSEPVFLKAGRGHLLSAGFGVFMIGGVVASLLSAHRLPAFLHVGLYTPLIFAAYLVGIRAVFYYEKGIISEYVEAAVEDVRYGHVPMSRAVKLYALNAALIVAAATLLPQVADRLAEETGLGRTFMGSVFVAMTTSLPELVVSFAAVRMGAHDMAIGNLLGSNMFNILILAVDDLFFVKGPLFSHVSTSHAVTGVVAVMMSAVAVIGLTYRPRRKAFSRFGWDALMLLGLWAFSIWFLYAERPGQ